MKYTNKSKKELSIFLEQIEIIIEGVRGVKFSDIKKVQSFLKDTDINCEIIGELNIIAETKYKRDEGTEISSSEKISINNKGFTLKSIYVEKFYSDFYFNDQMRVDEEEEEEFITEYLDAGYSAIEKILIEKDGILEIETNRFGLKKKRKKKEALA